jgi:hypothetical protein
VTYLDFQIVFSAPCSCGVLPQGLARAVSQRGNDCCFGARLHDDIVLSYTRICGSWRRNIQLTNEMKTICRHITITEQSPMHSASHHRIRGSQFSLACAQATSCEFKTRGERVRSITQEERASTANDVYLQQPSMCMSAKFQCYSHYRDCCTS